MTRIRRWDPFREVAHVRYPFDTLFGRGFVRPWRLFAWEAAETVISSPSATPVHVMSARAGLALTAVQRDDVAAAGEQYAAIESQRNRMVSWVFISADRLLGLLAKTMGNFLSGG